MTENGWKVYNKIVNGDCFYLDYGAYGALSTEDRLEVYQGLESRGDLLLPPERLKEFVQGSMLSEKDRVINDGFEVTLSDGESHAFSLELADQVKLIMLRVMALGGATQIPYEEKGKECRFYSAEDMTAICDAAQNHVLYHTSYSNSLKNYIDSLTEGVDMYCVYYGMEVPTEYQSDVFKTLFASNDEKSAS